MIKTEMMEINGKAFRRTWSDAYQIRQVETGAVYSEAVDPEGSAHTYEETDIPLPEADEVDALAAKAAMLDELEEAYDDDDQ